MTALFIEIEVEHLFLVCSHLSQRVIQWRRWRVQWMWCVVCAGAGIFTVALNAWMWKYSQCPQKACRAIITVHRPGQMYSQSQQDQVKLTDRRDNHLPETNHQAPPPPPPTPTNTQVACVALCRPGNVHCMNSSISNSSSNISSITSAIWLLIRSVRLFAATAAAAAATVSFSFLSFPFLAKLLTIRTSSSSTNQKLHFAFLLFVFGWAFFFDRISSAAAAP